MKKKKKTVSMADRKLAQARNSKNKQQLRKACKAVVEDGMEKKYATTRFGVKLRALDDWLYLGKWQWSESEFNMGTRVLPQEGEDILAQYVVMGAEIGAPLTKIAVCEYAYTMSKAYFGKDPPSTNLNGWFKGFLRRHNTIYSDSRTQRLKVKRKGQGLSRVRQLCMQPEKIEDYVTETIRPFLAKHPELTFMHIGGFDESMLDLNAMLLSGEVVAPPGGLMYTSVPSERSPHMTMLFGHIGNWVTPVLVVFAGETLDANWFEFLPDDDMVVVGVSSNGWITPDPSTAVAEAVAVAVTMAVPSAGLAQETALPFAPVAADTDIATAEEPFSLAFEDADGDWLSGLPSLFP